MADKTTASTVEGSLNDILRIRDIIFGQEMQEYEVRFQEQAARLDNLKAQLEALEKAVAEKQQRDRNQTEKEIEALKQMLLLKLEELDDKATARADLGAMLIAMGEKIKGN